MITTTRLVLGWIIVLGAGRGGGGARMAAAEKCCPGDLATSETKTDGWHPADWTLE